MFPVFPAVDQLLLLSPLDPRPEFPQVSQYIYFLFAPTLIYRDKYPRYPQVPVTVCVFFPCSRLCVWSNRVSPLMQEPSDQVELRSHKVSSGAKLLHILGLYFT